MGEVYRARDLKLKRDVAIKILPEEFARDADRVGRFQREAEVLASLNHPNIAAIFDVQESNGAQYLVLELLEGDTLADRLRRAPIPIEETLTIAEKVCEALESAHEKGVVHRDIKPANIMLRPDGVVKILDFGLAKLTEQQGMPDTELPTRQTDSRIVRGTVQYMSPEQARGQELDARTDLFSFGVVLYETATRHLPFPGSTTAVIFNAILSQAPVSPLQLNPELPARLDEIIQKALEKDRSLRYQSATDVHADLKRLKRDMDSAKSAVTQSPPYSAQRDTAKAHNGEPGSPKSGRLIIAAACVIFAFIVIGVAWWLRGTASSVDHSSSKPLEPVSYTQLTDQPGEELYPSLSPDGKSFVYTSRASGNWDIYFQRVGGKNPVNLTKDSEADDTQPAFSLDGERIAFRSERDGGGIFLMGATGENVRRLTDYGYNPAWSPDGHEIVCASATFSNPTTRLSTQSQLLSVEVATGQKRLIDTSGMSLAMQPHWSPHGYRIAYWTLVHGQLDIFTVPAEGGEPVAVTNDVALDWNPVWSPDGAYLYFASDRGGSMNLWRAPIDERSGKVSGDMEPVTTPSPYSGYLTLSHSGRLVAYAQRTNTSNILRAAFDSSREAVIAKPTPVTKGSRVAASAEVSPDGEWVAFTSGSGRQENLFVVRTDGTDLRQLTDGVYSDRRPAWSPEGKVVAFHSNRSGKFEVWTIRPDGSALQQLTNVPQRYVTHPIWSPDGKRLVYSILNGIPFMMEFGTPWRSQSPQVLSPLTEPDTWFEAGSWSSDGRTLAGFLLRADGKFTGIGVYSLETGKYHRLTEFGWNPRWLSDSRRVLFTKNQRRRDLFGGQPVPEGSEGSFRRSEHRQFCGDFTRQSMDLFHHGSYRVRHLADEPELTSVLTSK